MLARIWRGVTLAEKADEYFDMNIMRIRMATEDDAPAIASTLYRAFLEFEPLYTPEAFATTISSPDQIRLRLSEGPIWVVAQDGMVIGTVSVTPRGDALYIRGMAVDSAARYGSMKVAVSFVTVRVPTIYSGRPSLRWKKTWEVKRNVRYSNNHR